MATLTREHFTDSGQEKVCYANKSEAKKVIRKMMNHGVQEAGQLQAYKCSVCGYFHVGHKPKCRPPEILTPLTQPEPMASQTKKDPIEVIFNKATEIIHKKNHDYDKAFSKAYYRLGKTYAAGKIYEKTERIITLSQTEAEVKSESLADSLMDCIGYCALYLAELMEEE